MIVARHARSNSSNKNQFQNGTVRATWLSTTQYAKFSLNATRSTPFDFDRSQQTYQR